MSMKVQQLQLLLMKTEKQLDYWTPRKDSCLEGQEQHEYYTKFMEYIVKNCHDFEPVLQNGPNIVFPSL